MRARQFGLAPSPLSLWYMQSHRQQGLLLGVTNLNARRLTADCRRLSELARQYPLKQMAERLTLGFDALWFFPIRCCRCFRNKHRWLPRWGVMCADAEVHCGSIPALSRAPARCLSSSAHQTSSSHSAHGNQIVARPDRVQTKSIRPVTIAGRCIE
jgi:hypothetical protein